MRLLARYLLREMVGPAIAALPGFVVLITGHVLFTVVDVIAGKGVRFESILEFAALKTPEAAVLALPVATLLGCSLALNRLASDNELAPLFAGGIGGYRLLMAPLLLGTLATVLSVGIKEWAVPAADQQAQSLMREMLLRQKTLAFKPNRFLDTGGRWVFLPREVDRDRDMLRGVVCLMKRPGAFPVVICAKSAHFTDRRLWAEGVNTYEFTYPDKLNWLRSPSSVIDLGNLSPGTVGGASMQNRPLSELVVERAAYRAGGPGATREYDMEIHGRLSLAVACLVFALLSVPVAMRCGRAQTLAGVLATLVVAFVYFVVMLVMRLLGNNGALPAPVAAWTQDVVLLFAAFASMRRV